MSERGSAVRFPMALWKGAALYGFVLATTLPVVAEAAPSSKAASVALSAALLYLLPYVLAAMEEVRGEGTLTDLADNTLVVQGARFLPLAAALLFYERTGQRDRAIGAAVLLYVLIHSFLHHVRPGSFFVVLFGGGVFMVGGLAGGIPLATAMLPLQFTLLAASLMADHLGDRLRHHGRWHVVPVPSMVTALGLLIGALLVGGLSFPFDEWLLRSMRGAPDASIESLLPPLPAEEPRAPAVAVPGGGPGSSRTGPRRAAPARPVAVAPDAAHPVTPGVVAPDVASGSAAPPQPVRVPGGTDPQPVTPTLEAAPTAPSPPTATAAADASPVPPSSAVAIRPAGSSPAAPAPEPARAPWRAVQWGGVLVLLGILLALRLRREAPTGKEEKKEAPTAGGSLDGATEAGLRLGAFSRAPRDPRTRIVHFYNRVFEESRSLGFADHVSADEWASRLAALLQPIEMHVLLLARSFEQAKYSRRAITPDLSDHAEEAARLILKELHRKR